MPASVACMYTVLRKGPPFPEVLVVRRPSCAPSGAR
ncbi:hypothetical protein O3G_MSEX002604 [Manduca sexta]|uniref:Uncharacterized protein n=1 Tax=Manduca sexta TaxID=7130 RepID=A0A921YPW7_MANSE|nr:hypothetical protein O3G_MSEX002604 [Manduca sexta]